MTSGDPFSSWRNVPADEWVSLVIALSGLVLGVLNHRWIRHTRTMVEESTRNVLGGPFQESAEYLPTLSTDAKAVLSLGTPRVYANGNGFDLHVRLTLVALPRANHSSENGSPT